MTQEEAKTKEIPGLKQTVGKEIVGNAIVMTIILLCSWGMTFGLWGPPRGIGTFLGYIACMVPFFTVIQAYVPFINKRAEFGHGKWELKDDEKELSAGPVVNVWTRILPRALVYGFGAMLILLVLMKLSGWVPDKPVIVVLIVLVVNIVTTTLLIKKYLPEDMLAFAKASSAGKSESPQPLAGYMVVEHIIPFAALQLYINACVAVRAFPHEIENASKLLGKTIDFVPIISLTIDAAIVFILLALIHWMFSNSLTRGDVRLGRVAAENLKNISGWGALGLIFLAGIAVAVLYAIILKVGGVQGLSVPMATIFKMAIVILSVAFGSWIGVRWGGAREYAEMKG